MLTCRTRGFDGVVQFGSETLDCRLPRLVDIEEGEDTAINGSEACQDPHRLS